jgi:hypothetical protein
MIPLTELIIGLVLGVISAVAIPLTALLMIGTALVDNAVIDYPIPVWPDEKGTITVNPASWRGGAKLALIVTVGGLWWVYQWGLTNAASMPRAITRTGLGTAAIVMVAGVLFALKQRHLLVYAGLEVLLGVGVAGFTMYRLGDVIAVVDLVGVVTAMYFVVRGLDNLKKGYEEKESRP